MSFDLVGGVVENAVGTGFEQMQPYVPVDVTDNFAYVTAREYGEPTLGPNARVSLTKNYKTHEPQLIVQDYVLSRRYNHGEAPDTSATISTEGAKVVDANLLLSQLTSVTTLTKDGYLELGVRRREGALSLFENVFSQQPAEQDAEVFFSYMMARLGHTTGYIKSRDPNEAEVEFRRFAEKSHKLAVNFDGDKGMIDLAGFYAARSNTSNGQSLVLHTDIAPSDISQYLVKIPDAKGPKVLDFDKTGGFIFKILNFGNFSTRVSRVVATESERVGYRDRMVQDLERLLSGYSGTRTVQAIGQHFTDSETRVISAKGSAANSVALASYGDAYATRYNILPVMLPATASVGNLFVSKINR